MSKPDKAFRLGLISASVFTNEISTDGATRTARSVVLQRRYRDANGDWQSTNSLSPADVSAAICVLQAAQGLLLEADA